MLSELRKKFNAIYNYERLIGSSVALRVIKSKPIGVWEFLIPVVLTASCRLLPLDWCLLLPIVCRRRCRLVHETEHTHQVYIWRHNSLNIEGWDF